MRVCYHIETHRCGEQIDRLVRTILRSSDSAIVVLSHDERGEPLDVAGLKRLPNVYVRVEPGGYGDISHVRRYLATAKWLTTEGIDYDWLSNLTGQDYPVQPLGKVETSLEETAADGFIQYFNVFATESRWGLKQSVTRYGYSFRRLALTAAQGRRARPLAVINRLQPWLRFVPAYGAVGTRTSMPFDNRQLCYGGSYFCTLSADCVSYVVQYFHSHPEWFRYLSGTLAPEEIFLQTILVNSHEFRLINDCKRYFDFRGGRANHPRTLTLDDVDRVRLSGAFFARKFSLDVSIEALNELDRLMDEDLG